MPRLAAVAHQRERVAVRHQPRTGTAAEFRQQSSAIETHGATVACDEFVEIDRRQRRRRFGLGRHRMFQPQPPQLQGRLESQRTVDRGARRRCIEPCGQAMLGRGRQTGIDQPGGETAAAPAFGHQHHADPGIAGRVGQQRRAGDEMRVLVAHAEHGCPGQEETPVGLVLVPVRFRRKQESRGRIIRAERDDGCLISIGHRAPHIWWACPGSAWIARPSRPSILSVDQYRRWAGRTI